mmetsp:Transcript_21224/g.52305  ORF Transcript_21224/g.52305 Transcript_21224/m.52305 type:complete len:100 (+) Transcript_21224:118-417(+)|eukprot:CAMPEP_0184724410 /NCGR_PEP_ID=MMETSP0314-20130426/27854_1 /TAXON_ID=38298 /ORGANISM="Rhodella maculata, Strain CCMP 736" /LENGTH=99 /DNA_ID=CAMNT_0027189399 /DNA_START=116 /DNA_END=415 /DNA_ORIENTATION=-
MPNSQLVPMTTEEANRSKNPLEPVVRSAKDISDKTGEVLHDTVGHGGKDHRSATEQVTAGASEATSAATAWVVDAAHKAEKLAKDTKDRTKAVMEKDGF